MKKALLVTTVSGFIPQFEMNSVRILQRLGYEVHYASNYNNPSYGKDNHRLDGTGIVRHQIDFVRSPFRIENIKIYRQMKELLKKERFDLIHCHTPMGGVMARLAAHSIGIKNVVYTAHGFHFYNGAPVINWVCYYPIEKFLSYYTKQQICINMEDYRRAKKFHASYVDYIPGAGVDWNRIQSLPKVSIKDKREELGIPLNRTFLLSTGELIKRKNHETVIRAIAMLKAELSVDEMPIYVICGHGILQDYLKKLSEDLNVAEYIRFMGYREDIMEIYQVADIFIFPSFQEGLPMAMLEAMASGLPIICSAIRGNTDLMEQCGGGVQIRKADDVGSYYKAIKKYLKNPEKCRVLGERNRIGTRAFDIEKVKGIMEGIYIRLGT